MSGFPCARPEYAGFAPVQDEVGPFLCQLAPAIDVQRTAMALSTLSFSLCTDDRAAASDVQVDQRGGADDASVFELL